MWIPFIISAIIFEKPFIFIVIGAIVTIGIGIVYIYYIITTPSTMTRKPERLAFMAKPMTNSKCKNDTNQNSCQEGAST